MRSIGLSSFVFSFIAIVRFSDAQQIAEQKCREYRSLTVHETGIIPLISKPTPIIHEEYNCTNTVEVIVGGVEAQEGEFPHHALLGWKPLDRSAPEEFNFLCGGTLISDWFIMTAGHCVLSKPIVVRLGEHDLLEDDEDHHVDFDVANVVRHPRYKGTSAYYDIALVKVKQKIRFSAYIRPACLWTSKEINYTSATATGFGQVGFLTHQSAKLNKVKLEIYDNARCIVAFQLNRKFKKGIIDSQICAGSDADRDTCQGDSGGPLQVMIGGGGCTYHVVGITSHGRDACGWVHPVAIYTRVSSFVNWIEHVVWKRDDELSYGDTANQAEDMESK